MSQDQGHTPEHTEGASDRFKRLAGSEGEAPKPAAGDTQPSRPLRLKGDAPATGDTQPSQPIRISQMLPGEFPPSGAVPPDEAPTILQPAQPNEAPPPPSLGYTPASGLPPTDESGMPLPRRSAASEPRPPASGSTGPISRPSRPQRPAAQPGPAGGNKLSQLWRRISRMGCLPRAFILSAFAIIFLLTAGVAFALYEYAVIAASLPSVDDLRAHASQFETTRILDAEGNLLYEILDPSAGRRTYVPLEDISPTLVAATIATEDKEFYNHPGFNVTAIFRAFTQNYSSGEVVSGASTITQQLARILLFSPEEAGEQSYMRKVREAILASEITRRYSKDEILELYLNEIYYGNLAYGIEAAAQTYFGATAGQLSLSQASLLAGLPQAPSVYDVYTNREAVLFRQQSVLSLMVRVSAEDGCIYVSNSPQRVCVTVDEAANAGLEMLDYAFRSPDVQIRYPHWVHYIRFLLEQQYDPQTIYRSGFTVHTTLLPQLQDTAQQIVADQVADLAHLQVGSGALVALRPSDGHILAMVGSADFYNEDIDGQINMAVSPRQPGSSIKPLTYVAAFEKGWTASTLIWDVESEFPPSGVPGDPRPPYIPRNYDNRFHGPVTVRSALANSYNIPAVKALDFVGVYDDPNTTEEEGLVAFAHRLGISDLQSDQYGLALTLGGGEVKLLDLTNAYAIFANQGRQVTPVAITRITDYQGNIIFEAPEPSNQQIIREEHAFLISSILSDNDARRPMFGANSVLNLPFRAAAKTGTTDDFRDNWTLGYTPDLAVGVWVGNPDNTEMDGSSGLSGAAPIWAEFMQQAIGTLAGGNPAPFLQPVGVVEKVICSVSGAEPSQYCDQQRREYFAADQPPADADNDLWQDARIDTWTQLEASSACNQFVDEIFSLNVDDVWAIRWITQTNDGRNWARNLGFDDPIVFSPSRECDDNDPRPTLEFTGPRDGDRLSNPTVEIHLIANASANFEEWVLEWRRADGGSTWHELENKRNPVPNAQVVHALNLQELPRGPIVLRLTIYSTSGGHARRDIVVYNDLPEPTATPTPTQAPSATPTATLPAPTATETPLPSETPTPTP
ncbi:MAG: transglycosylase domain-containing protein [Anaerolineales bacterium]|nr:transglycosylase domain-containing protein [Anaerolineales bacterium]MCW5855990.1 transglycosylase domain-containing protein [Anaerolineales bacterium]